MRETSSFFAPITFGNILTLLALIGTGVGIYTSLYADVRDARTEIANIKVNEIKKESADRELKKEIKEDVKEVKQDVKELRQTVDRVLLEVQKTRREVR